MSTYNGEPYPGFFRRENETDEQYAARQPKVSIDENGWAASWVEPATHPDIVELREEVAALKDALTRTEAFANSLLDEDTKVDISVIRTPINIPAKDARTLRVFKPKKVHDNEDYDRAMSLVGK